MSAPIAILAAPVSEAKVIKMSVFLDVHFLLGVYPSVKHQYSVQETRELFKGKLKSMPSSPAPHILPCTPTTP